MSPTKETPVVLKVIHHDECSKCAGLSTILDQHGIEWKPIRYMHGELTAGVLDLLFDRYEGAASDLVRDREAEEIDGTFDPANATTEEIKRFLHQHPEALQRPVVVAGEVVLVARPPERLLELIYEFGHA
ncbi:MAG: hypothetical protein R3284_01775 [Rubricoccaceae bacterium]|nr:hypothetical protein [Rubricoccaceae bacterium]